MKTSSLIMLALCVALVSTGCPRRAPDLAVVQFIANGPATLNEADEVEIPVVVAVENQGNTPAPIFRLSAYYEAQTGTFYAPFTVEGELDPEHPFSDELLAPGETVTFAGVITVSERNATLPFFVEADSCFGEDGMPGYCRVNESDEDNNVGGPLNVVLP